MSVTVSSYDSRSNWTISWAVLWSRSGNGSGSSSGPLAAEELLPGVGQLRRPRLAWHDVIVDDTGTSLRDWPLQLYSKRFLQERQEQVRCTRKAAHRRKGGCIIKVH